MKVILESRFGELPISISYIRDYFALSESDDDITSLLQAAVEHVELQNGLSLQKKVWKVIHNNDYIVLGYGPVVKLLSITDAAGVDVEPVCVRRSHDTLIIQLAEADKMTHIRYEAGYLQNTLPECLKHTILERFWDVYSESFAVNIGSEKVAVEEAFDESRSFNF